MASYQTYSLKTIPGASQRPDSFTLDMRHYLARGLVFAGLGRAPGSTRYHDSSAFGNHGTLTNMEAGTDWVWRSKIQRWLLDLDGTDEGVSLVKSDFPPVGDTTISCWVSADGAGTSGFGRLLDNGKLAAYYDGSDYRILFSLDYFSNLSGSANNSLPIGALKHLSIAFTSTGSTNFYINGIASGGAQPSGTPASGSYAATIGNRPAAERGWDGQVGDMLIHTRILSVAEIQQLADPSNVMLSGLIVPPRRRLFAFSQSVTPSAWASIFDSCVIHAA